MARPRDSLRAQKGPRAPAQNDQAIPSQDTKKVPAQRRSERIYISQLQGSIDGREPEKRHASLSVQENQHLPLPPTRQKRVREEEVPTDHVPIERPQKRLRPSPFGPSHRQTFDQRTVSGLSASQQSHISHWAEQRTWPKEYFETDRMHPLLARQKSSASLRRKRSETSLTRSVTPSDQRPREEKSAPYRNPSYQALLEALGDSYMKESKLGITDASKALQEDLLERECTTPKGTLFRDDVIETACQNIQDRNEARIIQDSARLLVPPPESLAMLGDTDLDVLVESVNEGWNSSIPITSPRPQPDFAVGFRRSVFSDDQLSKIQPLLGDFESLSCFKATYYMLFPFLTCEVKCGAAGLELADRQNAHSMTLAVRGIVELFKLGKREKELHRELLTFSISHDHRTVRLYGYYPVFDGPKTKTHRHQIHIFDIAALNGKEKWTTYKFTVAVYHHSLTLLNRILSIVDDLPPDFALQLTQQSEAQLSEPSGLSQQLDNQVLAEISHPQSSQLDLQQMTPDTSTQDKAASKQKKKKKKV
ncbi:hypothetical protein LTR47_008257 [Exophiala xenobiotica]|nr:hypothetical protein LTR47_008257 [Exophiala xenobiotica]KAK5253319.1 hypothetical protein LTS06_002283 [Exophiala xenobiotica]KAK5316115.1 hypothetical protein LTR93_009443 [Exophiala xenobiotica]KAK5346269.1 hypothetical protein LTR61_009934 [Exophiala xenobiotica]KAK5361071.1 hypothetical protein LTR11_009944 [Exophiala xenobiotica]